MGQPPGAARPPPRRRAGAAGVSGRQPDVRLAGPAAVAEPPVAPSAAAARPTGSVDHVIAISAGVADDVRAVIGPMTGRLAVLPNPSVPTDLDRQAAQAVAHPWFAHADRPLLLAAGRLVAAKDFALLLRAFARLRRERPARLVILGEGPLRAALLALAAELGVADDLDLPGFVDQPGRLDGRASLFVRVLGLRGRPQRADRGAGLRHAGGQHRLPARPAGDPGPRPLGPAGAARRRAAHSPRPWPPRWMRRCRPQPCARRWRPTGSTSRRGAYLAGARARAVTRRAPPDLAVLLATSGHSGVDRVMGNLLAAWGEAGLCHRPARHPRPRSAHRPPAARTCGACRCRPAT